MNRVNINFGLLMGAALLMASCGGPLESDAEGVFDSNETGEEVASSAEETIEWSTETSALTTCGTACPSGTHPVRYSYSSSCCSGFSCDRRYPNRVECANNSGSFFTSCGMFCPSGYYASSHDYASQCCRGGYCSISYNNQTRCNRIPSSGITFQACGLSCPSGYTKTGSMWVRRCCWGSDCPSSTHNCSACR